MKKKYIAFNEKGTWKEEFLATDMKDARLTALVRHAASGRKDEDLFIEKAANQPLQWNNKNSMEKKKKKYVAFNEKGTWKEEFLATDMKDARLAARVWHAASGRKDEDLFIEKAA